jgi:hypothetical protein
MKTEYIDKKGNIKTYNYDYNKINDIDLLCDLVNEKYNLKSREIGSIERYKDMYVLKIVQIGNNYGGFIDLKSGNEKELKEFLRLILDEKIKLNVRVGV